MNHRSHLNILPDIWYSKNSQATGIALPTMRVHCEAQHGALKPPWSFTIMLCLPYAPVKGELNGNLCIVLLIAFWWFM